MIRRAGLRERGTLFAALLDEALHEGRRVGLQDGVDLVENVVNTGNLSLAGRIGGLGGIVAVAPGGLNLLVGAHGASCLTRGAARRSCGFSLPPSPGVAQL